MGKSRQKHKERMQPFVPIRLDMLESTAYQTLPPSAAKLYPYFLRTCIRAVKGAPDTTTLFGLTYAEATKYGFARRTFHDAVKALEIHGFIDIVSVGGLRGAGHTNSQYKLSNRWVAYGGLGWAIQAKKEEERAKKYARQDGNI